jgi:hypothetical protein
MKNKKNKLGVFMTFFDETNAIKYAISSLRRFYQDSPIYVVYESDEDFSFLKKDINTVYYKVDDTMSSVLGINDQNFRTEKNQKNIKIATLAVIERVTKAIQYLESEYILQHCPDSLVRGELTIPENTGLLGSRVNQYFSDDVNKVLIKYGGIPINAFGAVPAIYNSVDFLRAKDIFLNNKNLLDELCNAWYPIFSHDILLPILFSLLGKSETFNPEITECERNPNWNNSNHPLIHQFRFYYPSRTSKYKVNENNF